MTTLNCHQTRSLLMAWLDSELDAVTTVEIGEHLAVCATCRARFEAEQALETGLREQLRAERMPPEVWERLTARLQAEGRPRARRSRWIPLAAAALVLLAVVLLLRDSGRATDPADLERREFLRSFASAHAASQRSLATGPEGVSELLGEAGFAELQLPDLGVVDGHPIHLRGASLFEVEGRPCVELSYECCSEPVSVFVVDAASLPEATARDDRLTEGGLSVHALRRGELLLGVVSSHRSRLPHSF